MNVLPISAINIDSDEAAAPIGFHDTMFPSSDTEIVPSCFLYCATASAILLKESVSCTLDNDAELSNADPTSARARDSMNTYICMQHYVAPVAGAVRSGDFAWCYTVLAFLFEYYHNRSFKQYSRTGAY